MEASSVPVGFIQSHLSLPGRVLPPAIPLIISSQDSWNPDSNVLESSSSGAQSQELRLVDEAVELLQTIDKPMAVLSICGPYRTGKSYFISRVLGLPGAFRLGHSMQACTRGIWMATTVLECEKFVTVLLDTEGIDAVGASETLAMSLLTLTTLLSSFLIYNSKRVPQKVDLSKMNCFTQLSSSFLAQGSKSATPEAIKNYFPQFLWLLRDVTLKMTNRAGEIIQPTEYLHTCILASESGAHTELGRCLVSLFPSLECATLPIPSTKRDIICNIVQRQENLKPAFNEAVESLVHKIVHQLSPKVAVDGVTHVNGCILSSLAQEYVETINKPGALPDLDQGWQAVIKVKLQEFSEELVREYKKDMEKELKGNLPMEESNLMQLHQQILNSKKASFKQEIRCVNPLSSSNRDIAPLLQGLEKAIVQTDDEVNPAVVGGALFQFTTENYTVSKQYCESVFTEKVRESGIEAEVTKAIMESLTLNVDEKTSTILKCYCETAVGPAATEVMERGLTELQKLKDTLKMIPGKPLNLRVIGKDSDRIKLSWEPPKHNPEAVKYFIVSRKATEEEQWEEVRQTTRTRALITGLKPDTDYEFQVQSANDLVESLKIGQSSHTMQTFFKAGTAAACEGGVKGAALSSYNLLALTHLYTIETNPFKSHPYDRASPKAKKLVTRATMPLSILLSPISAPVGAAVIATFVVKHQKKTRECSKGDLTYE